MRDRSRKRDSESGFALLFIYAMAAILAIMLYREIPRVAFEAQRDKEQLLVDRGEQYSRAIQLYVRKFNKFPADFDALNNTQNLRFLRHKYKDPMTGKDDWRIIHAGPGGTFTDSLVYGKKKDDKQQADQQTFITELQQTGGNPVDPNQNVNVGTRQRQSDQPGAPGDPNNPAQPPQLDPNGQPIPNAANPGQVLPNGQIAPFPQQGNQPGGFPPGAPFPGGAPFPPGAPIPGGTAGATAGGTPYYPGGVPGAGGVPLTQQPFQQPGGPPTAAGNLINQILTTPRPGGLNGIGGIQQGVSGPNTLGSNVTAGGITTGSTGTGAATTPTAAIGQTIGGGIAGVASKLEEDGIKIYKDQTSYNKWEFVYDITKDPARAGGAVPTAAPPPGTPIGAAATTSATAPNGTPPPTGTPVPTPTPAPITPQ